MNLILLKHEIQYFSLANIGHVIYQLVPDKLVPYHKTSGAGTSYRPK